MTEGLLVAVETSAQAALAAPGGLEVADKNSSTPILKGDLLVLSTKLKDLRRNRLVATPAQTMARVLYRS